MVSEDPEAKNFPFGENATVVTSQEWPERVLISYPLDRFHKPMVVSEDPDAK